jgi:hypothetical protein
MGDRSTRIIHGNLDPESSVPQRLRERETEHRGVLYEANLRARLKSRSRREDVHFVNRQTAKPGNFQGDWSLVTSAPTLKPGSPGRIALLPFV